MPYTTLAALIERYGESELIQLTDRTGADVIDETIVDRAIADADGEIDAYLAKRMALPLATVPAVLERTAAVMARYYLYNDAPTDLVRAQYDAAIRLLRDVANGVVSLGADGAGGAVPETAAPSYYAPTPIFGDGGLDGYR